MFLTSFYTIYRLTLYQPRIFLEHDLDNYSREGCAQLGNKGCVNYLNTCMEMKSRTTSCQWPNNVFTKINENTYYSHVHTLHCDSWTTTELKRQSYQRSYLYASIRRKNVPVIFTHQLITKLKIKLRHLYEFRP